MNNCQECMKPEHDPKHYSANFVTPLALSAEILSLDTRDAWNTAGHVFFMYNDGSISYSKGCLATGSSKFCFRPAIPGLRLDFGGNFVTFAEDFDNKKKDELYKRLAQFVCIEILHRAKLLNDDLRSSRQNNRLVNGLPFQDKHVQSVLQTDDIFFARWTVSAVENNEESKKRKLNEKE